MDGLSGYATFERRLKEGERLVIERLTSIRLIAEVRREHQERMSRIAHHRLRHQTEIANACAVRGQRRLKSHLQRRGGGIELRRAANAADARSDDERVFGIAPDQDLLKAAVHRAHAPGVGDSVVVYLQLDFEVTFDTIQIHLDNAPSHSPNLHLRRTFGGWQK